MQNTEIKRERAILAGLAAQSMDEHERSTEISMEELAALVETHDEGEISSAVAAGARMIGVNNRNLKDFSVDFSNAARLRDLIPAGTLYVAESGVKSPEDVAALKKTGADAVLMGEVLMRAKDKGRMLAQMREAAQ